MSERLTQREIFEKITEIQAQLANMKDTLFQFQCVRDNLVLVDDEEAAYNQEVALEKLKTIKEVFAVREASLNSLLDFYKVMYKDLREDERAEKKSVPESESEIKRRKEFLNFVKDTTAVAAGASLPGSVAPALLPDFEKIWETVYLK